MHHQMHGARAPMGAGIGDLVLNVCGNELAEGFVRVHIKSNEYGSLDALLEILEARLRVSVITNLAIWEEEPVEEGSREPPEGHFEEVTALDQLPAAPLEAVARIQSKCTGPRKYPALLPYHVHPYTIHMAAADGQHELVEDMLKSAAPAGGESDAGEGSQPKLLGESWGDGRTAGANARCGGSGRAALHFGAEAGRARTVVPLAVGKTVILLTFPLHRY